MEKQANVLFVTIDGGGNLPPVLGLARDLSERAYQVSVLSEPCMEEVITGLGYNFIPFQQYFTRKDRKEDIFKDWNASPVKNPTLDNIVFGPARILAEETMRAIRQTDAQLVVADCLLPAALIAAEASRIPGVLAFHMPEYFPGANRPPGMFGLKPGKGMIGRFRDRVLTQLFHKRMDQFLPVLNEARTRWNLTALERTSDLIHGADLRLIQTLERFDFPIDPKPSNVRYTGPVLDDPDWTSSWSNPWPPEDIRGLVTLGPVLDKDDFTAPENVMVVDSAPHSRVFPLAKLVITHAGHGTVMRALSHGLPMVCLPMGRDQNDNAVKVQHHGCGIALSAKAGPGKIRNAVQKILTEDSYRQTAGRFRDDILAGDQGRSVLQEIQDLIVPVHENALAS